jgi:hypothetical protein
LAANSNMCWDDGMKAENISRSLHCDATFKFSRSGQYTVHYSLKVGVRIRIKSGTIV